MAGLSDWASGIKQWYDQNIGGTPSTPAFFQSRITRTPGVMAPTDVDKNATYDPAANPSQVVKNSGLDQQTATALSALWKNQPNGMMTVNPNAPGSVIRHESMHDLFNRGNLAPNSADIAGTIDPGVVSSILQEPVYQKEISHFGTPNVLADEGSALSLGEYSPISKNDQMKAMITKLLSQKGKNTELKQFKELSK